MKVSCTINIDFGNPKKAEQIIRSIKVDDFEDIADATPGERRKEQDEAETKAEFLHNGLLFSSQLIIYPDSYKHYR